jgi:hypothetical protein
MVMEEPLVELPVPELLPPLEPPVPELVPPLEPPVPEEEEAEVVEVVEDD